MTFGFTPAEVEYLALDTEVLLRLADMQDRVSVKACNTYGMEFSAGAHRNRARILRDRAKAISSGQSS